MRNSTLTEHIHHFPWFIKWQIRRWFGPRVAKPIRPTRGRYAQEQNQKIKFGGTKNEYEKHH